MKDTYLYECCLHRVSLNAFVLAKVEKGLDVGDNANQRRAPARKHRTRITDLEFSKTTGREKEVEERRELDSIAQREEHGANMPPHLVMSCVSEDVHTLVTHTCVSTRVPAAPAFQQQSDLQGLQPRREKAKQKAANPAISLILILTAICLGHHISRFRGVACAIVLLGSSRACRWQRLGA